MEKENTFFEDYKALIDSFDRLKKDAQNPFYKSGYVQLKDVLRVVKEKCHKHNFIFIQKPEFVEGKNLLITGLLHESGKEIKGRIEIVAKDPTDPQKVGAGLTYMRRYSLSCMLGLEEEDDDGNSASGKRAVSPGMGGVNVPKKIF